MKLLGPALALCFLLSCNNKPSTAYSNVDVEKFNSMMISSSNDVVILDVRTPQEIANGKIENALEIDFRADDFTSKIQNLEKDKTYLVYCKSGGRSVKSCELMAANGFEKLYNLEGGYMAWSKANSQ